MIHASKFESPIIALCESSALIKIDYSERDPYPSLPCCCWCCWNSCQVTKPNPADMQTSAKTEITGMLLKAEYLKKLQITGKQKR
mmetsp:Transcript_30645/g.63343  ORF Transcript_30645/g.63343 Transcript_30645/m.63343 type:complete len:85 (-) Transcript_30645:605-859(-)